MADINKLIVQIKESDLRTTNLTWEMKEMENKMKVLESELSELLTKEKQLAVDISCKRNTVDNKTVEESHLTDHLGLLEKKLEDEKVNNFEQEEKLEELQRKLWVARASFSEDACNFIAKNDFLVTNKERIVDAAKKTAVEKNLNMEIFKLEKDVSELEIEYQNLKSHLDLVEHLKMDKQILEGEPDNGSEFKRLRNRIEICLKELNKFDSAMVRASSINIANQTSVYTTINIPIVSDDSSEHLTLELHLPNYSQSLPALDFLPSERCSFVMEQMVKSEKHRTVANFIPKVASGILRMNKTQGEDNKK